MKTYSWSPEKNELLKELRGVGFEDIVFHIEAGDEVAVLNHPNQTRYPGQQISVVMIEGYAYPGAVCRDGNRGVFEDHHPQPQGNQTDQEQR